jgi:D-alanine-D-alanine ligase
VSVPRRSVALLFGGPSVEHEVSLTSARGVARAMAESTLECVPLGVTGEGRWLSPAASRRVLESSAARVESPEGTLERVMLDTGTQRLVVVAGDGTPRPIDVDVVFPLIHGRGGEDGRLQGALDLLGLPYVGAGVLGSAVAMDKLVTKTLLAAAGLPVTPGIGVIEIDHRHDPAATRRRIEDELCFPVFVKPANGGSSVGVTRVPDAAALASALDVAFECDGRVVVERAIEAREIECAVLGNQRPEASILGEIRPSREFYDYAAKYLEDSTELLVPAPLDGPAAERLRELAVRAFRALDLRGLARVDFLVERASGAAYVNEVNTLPGFTPISMFPRLWEASGIPFPRLVERLVELAIERAREEEPRRTRRDG